MLKSLMHTLRMSLTNFVLLLSTIVLLFLLGELICRIWVPRVVYEMHARTMYSDILKSHPVLRRVLKPNHSGRIVTNEVDFRVNTNSKGLRDREFSYKTEQTIKRILVLGDSFTFGYGIADNETYPKLLENKLNQKFRGQFEVINAAVTGWGTPQERDYLKIEGVKYNPDLILVGFYINDVKDTFSINSGVEDSISYWERKDAALKSFAKYRPWLRLKLFFREWSYFFTVLNQKSVVVVDGLDKRYNPIGNIAAVLDYNPWGVSKEGISIIDFDKRIEEDAEIVSWKIYSLSENRVRLKVWRYSGEDSWIVVGESQIREIRPGVSPIRITKPILVKKGDVLGFYCSNGNISRNIPYTGNKIYSWGDVKKITESTMREDRCGGYSFKAYPKHRRTVLSKVVACNYAYASVISNVSRQAVNKKIGDIKADCYALYRKNYHSDTVNAWASTMKILSEINQIGYGIGAKVIFLYLPTRIEVGRAIDGEVVALTEHETILDKPRHMFLRYMNDNGLDVIDLTSYFENSDYETLYLKDSHFNKFGHKIAADGVAKDLTTKFPSYLLSAASATGFR